MSKTKVFISYSRADTDYVSTLVDALRARGFDAWFDANIRTGNEWDNAIEREIKEAQVMVLILSKSSVASDNVKDEMSYALQLDKFVNPIKIEECDIPMRLARRQFIDFDAIGFEAGLDRLVEDMKHQVGEKSSKTTDPTIAKVIVDKTKEETKTPTVKKPIAESRKETAASVSVPKKKNTVLLYIGVGIIILLLGAFVVPKLLPDKDKEAFDAALSTNSRAAYENYLETFPQGKFTLQARDSTESKLAQERAAESIRLMKLEDAQWAKTGKEGDKVAYQIYIRDYPEGRYVNQALDSIKKRDRDAANIAKDNTVWNIVKSKNTVSAYLEYFINPEVIGLHKDEAIDKVKEIGSEGYLFYGRPRTDGTVYERVFDRICCGGSDLLKDGVPEAGDVLLTLKSRNTYKDAKTQYKTNKTVKAGTKALVTEVQKPSDNSILVKIRY